MSIKKAINWIVYVIDESIRITSLVVILVPSSYLLPKKWAIGVADILSLLLVFSPRTGPDVYWKMRRVFGKGRIASFKLAWGWLGRGYRDFVIHKRIIYKRDNPSKWHIVERNAEYINSIRESGESYLVVSGHFQHGLIHSVYSRFINYGRIIRISDPPPIIRTLGDLRCKYQWGMNPKSFACWCDRNSEVVYNESDLRIGREIYNLLRERGNVVFIDIDPFKKKTSTGTYERPFAGWKKGVFATGTAEIARLVKCPIICYVVFLERDGTIVIEWEPPILNTGMEKYKVIDVMDKLLDRLEIAVGERPTQYVLDIGGERRWNSIDRRWEDLNE